MNRLIRSRLGWLGVCLALPAFLICLWFPPFSSPVNAVPLTIDNSTNGYIVSLHETANIKDSLPASLLAKRTTILQRLQTTAQESQAPVIELLQTWQKNGRRIWSSRQKEREGIL